MRRFVKSSKTLPYTLDIGDLHHYGAELQLLYKGKPVEKVKKAPGRAALSNSDCYLLKSPEWKPGMSGITAKGNGEVFFLDIPQVGCPIYNFDDKSVRVSPSILSLRRPFQGSIKQVQNSWTFSCKSLMLWPYEAVIYGHFTIKTGTLRGEVLELESYDPFTGNLTVQPLQSPLEEGALLEGLLSFEDVSLEGWKELKELLPRLTPTQGVLQDAHLAQTLYMIYRDAATKQDSFLSLAQELREKRDFLLETATKPISRPSFLR